MQVIKPFVKAVVLGVVFCSCNNKTEISKNQDTLFFNEITKVPYLDTTTYSIANTSYKSLEDAIGKDSPSYFIDSFSQRGNDFRLIYKLFDISNGVTLEKLTNGKWIRRIEFDKFNGAGLITHAIDVNNDGFKDILRESRFFSLIYLYNPAINNFIDTSCGDLNNDVYLIDTLHNIYCDFQEYRQHCRTIASTLYTYKNYTKYYLYRLELYNCDDDRLKVTKLILSKCTNGKLEGLEEIKTYKLQKPLDTDAENYFDNKNFWKREYKGLLKYN